MSTKQTTQKNNITWGRSDYSSTYGLYNKPLIVDGVEQENVEISRYEDTKRWFGVCPVCHCNVVNGTLKDVKKAYAEHYIACRDKHAEENERIQSSILRKQVLDENGNDLEVIQIEVNHQVGNYILYLEKQVRNDTNIWKRSVFRKDNGALLGRVVETGISRSDIDSTAIVHIAKRLINVTLDYVLGQERKTLA